MSDSTSSPRTPVVGVLALQGDYEAHARAIEHAGGISREINRADQLAEIDGLIIPGGESSTMLKLIDYENLFEPLKAFGQSKPVFGTCAGAILIARDVINPSQASFDLMDIGVERNAYGRQRDSHIVPLQAEGLGELEAVFIRAPIIRRVGDGVTVLATHRGDAVLVTQGLHMAATFHPELTADSKVHRMFIERLKT
jgi:5'-phosphate synthase pdxT subunit